MNYSKGCWVQKPYGMQAGGEVTLMRTHTRTSKMAKQSLQRECHPVQHKDEQIKVQESMWMQCDLYLNKI